MNRWAESFARGGGGNLQNYVPRKLVLVTSRGQIAFRGSHPPIVECPPKITSLVMPFAILLILSQLRMCEELITAVHSFAAKTFSFVLPISVYAIERVTGARFNLHSALDTHQPLLSLLVSTFGAFRLNEWLKRTNVSLLLFHPSSSARLPINII